MSIRRSCVVIALAGLLTLLMVGRAKAVVTTDLTLTDPDDAGVNSVRLIVDEITNPPLFEPLSVVIQPTAIPPTGLPFHDPIDPLFTGDFDAILSSNGLTRFDVESVMFMRQPLADDMDLERRLDVVTSSDSIILGTGFGDPGLLINTLTDPNDFPTAAQEIFDTIDVVQGSVETTLTLTLTTTPRFEDTLTIKTFADPPPAGGTVPEPVTASLALLSLGAIGVATRRRRR